MRVPTNLPALPRRELGASPGATEALQAAGGAARSAAIARPCPLADDLPFVSVIVPVFNDPVRLRTCLQALGRQSYPRDRFEVIVVDNGSAPPAGPVVDEHAPARCVVEPRPGSYAARNRGIAEAIGVVLAFTDADCIPAPTWIERGVDELRSVANCGLVAGEIVVSFRDPLRPTACELFTLLTLYRQRRNAEVEHFGATANVFTWRQVVEAVGPFDAGLRSYGDVVFGRQVFAAGYGVVYAPTAVVVHPGSHSLAELGRRVARITGGKRDLRRGATGAPAERLLRHVGQDIGQFGLFLSTILTDRRLAGPIQRLKVVGVLLLMQQVVLFERLRLQLGGASRR